MSLYDFFKKKKNFFTKLFDDSIDFQQCEANKEELHCIKCTIREMLTLWTNDIKKINSFPVLRTQTCLDINDFLDSWRNVYSCCLSLYILCSSLLC